MPHAIQIYSPNHFGNYISLDICAPCAMLTLDQPNFLSLRCNDIGFIISATRGQNNLCSTLLFQQSDKRLETIPRKQSNIIWRKVLNGFRCSGCFNYSLKDLTLHFLFARQQHSADSNCIETPCLAERLRASRSSSNKSLRGPV